MDNTKIEWSDATWNPVDGCTKVSPGCANCYAEAIAKRLWGERRFEDIRYHPERLYKPLQWRRRRRVFVNSMSDLFHEGLTDATITYIFAVMLLAQRLRRRHIFQVLTKRAERMCDFMNAPGRIESIVWTAARFAQEGPPAVVKRFAPPMSMESRVNAMRAGIFEGNVCGVWLGVSAENQRQLDARVPLLLDTPAERRFLSAEPLLGPIDLQLPHYIDPEPLPGLDWVIVGGESGNGARPCNIDWIDDLVAQCKDGPPLFIKQLGSRPVCDDDQPWPCKDWKGAAPAEWPVHLQGIREMPTEVPDDDIPF